MDILLLIIGAVTVVLLILVLVKLSGKSDTGAREVDMKIDNLSKAVSDGFVAVRSDVVSQNENMRASLNSSLENVRSSVNGSLENVRDKMEKLTEKNTDSQINVVRSLADMREKLDEAGKQQTAAVSEAVEKLMQSNEKKLEEMRLTVDEKLSATLNQRLDSSFKSVSEQLSNVYKSLGEMKELGEGVTALNRIFTNVKVRGNWGETQLEGILDRIIPGMYVKNYRSDEKRDVVEFAVIIPDPNGEKKTYLPIDSKFPMEDYLRLCDAADSGDPEAVKAAQKAIDARVLSEGKAVAKYINPPFTTPFAVLYLATDSLYAQVVSSKENIADRLHDEFGVLLAGPSTITALLSSLAMGFRTVALNQKADEVMDLLAAAKTQYDKFGLALEKAKRKLEEASVSIDDAQKRNTIIVKKLKGVETVEAGQAENLLGTEE